MREDLLLLGVSLAFVRKLTKNRIYSLAELVAVPLPTLAQLLRTPEASLVPLVARANTILAAPLSAVEVRDERVSTGLRELDVLLDGGFLPGGLYEIVAGPGVDATLLCLRVAFSISPGRCTLFCDSEGNFSLSLVRKSTSQVPANFHYLRISTHSQFTQLLSEFETVVPSPPFLVVMDGLYALLRCLPAADGSFDRTQKVVETALALQEVANTHACVFLLTNKLTSTGGESVPLLGDSWSQSLMARIIIEQTQDGTTLRAQKSAGWEATGEVTAYSLK